MDTDELLAYIEQNIKEDISLVDFAQVVHYSPRQVYYKIKSRDWLQDYSRKHASMHQDWSFLMLRHLVEGTEPNIFTSR